MNLIDPTGHRALRYDGGGGGGEEPATTEAASTPGTDTTQDLGAPFYGAVAKQSGPATVIIAGGVFDPTPVGLQATLDLVNVQLASRGENGYVTGGVNLLGGSSTTGLTRDLATMSTTADGNRMRNALANMELMGTSYEAHVVKANLGGGLSIGRLDLGVNVEGCAVCAGETWRVGRKGIDVGVADFVGIKMSLRWRLR